MADTQPDKASGARIRSYEDQRLLAGVYLFTIYVLLAPLVSALAVWSFHELFVPRSGFLDLGHALGFWLTIAFAGTAPVLLLAAFAHFWFRYRPLAIIAAAVFGTGVLAWGLMAVVLDPPKIMPIVAMGLAVLCPAFLVASWACKRAIAYALPPARESAKPLI